MLSRFILLERLGIKLGYIILIKINLLIITYFSYLVSNCIVLRYILRTVRINYRSSNLIKNSKIILLIFESF